MLYLFGGVIFLALIGIAFLFLRRMPHYLPKRRIIGHQGPSLSSIKQSVNSAKPSKLPPMKFRRATLPPANDQVTSPLNAFMKKDGFKNEGFWISLIQNNPHNPYPYKKLGELYLQNDKKGYAKETFAYALKLAPKDKTIQRQLEKVQ